MSFAAVNKTKIIILVQAVLFFFLILFGISGSSISNIRGWVPGLLSMDEKVLIGFPRLFRSDEWAVNTLLSIGQYQNKESKNPRINSDLGPTPRDMAIIHDTGVPTAELSTLSKVNLWGFFLFDLRRALAWDWWIPVFVGLNGIWLLLNLLCPGQSEFNFSLALLFTLAPECVLWSNWPLMHVGTASLAVSFAILSLKNSNILITLTLAFFTGLFISWFVLQLYIPRLIPVALISVFTYVGYCLTNHVKFFAKSNSIFIIYTILVVSCFLVEWWSQKYDAISRMWNSSYPGQRRVYGGLPISRWDFNYVRGWLFPTTSYWGIGYKGKFINGCEAQSYISLFIPIMTLISVYLFKSYRHINYAVLFNFGLMVLFIAYEYVGVPKIIGQLSLLNRSTLSRAIIGIGFTSVILIAFLYRHRDIIIIRCKPIFLTIFLLPFVIFFYKNQEITRMFIEKDSNFFRFIYIVCFIIAINIIFLYKIKYLGLAMLMFVMPVTLFWNPIIIAPSHFQLKLPKEVSDNSMNSKYDGRLLVVGERSHLFVNVFFASGNKVMNATSHYVDPYMFDNFYSKLNNSQRYNSFNHLGIVVDNLKPDIGITFGGGDWIKMRLNAHSFDFGVLPVDYLAVRKSKFINDLNTNAKLKFIENIGDFFFYKVNR